MKKAIFAITLVATQAFAQEAWIDIGGNANVKSFILKNSLVVQNNKAGIEVAVVTTKKIWSKNNEVDLGKAYVATEDCRNRQGKIVTLSMDNKFRYENDFIFEAGSIATNLAEWVCAAYFYSIKQTDEKGL